jgi:signal transduction histidine kinase
MRRLLGVLRKDDEEPALAPQPSMARIGDLVERARSAGVPVDMRIDGAPGNLPAGVDLAAYRVVQEGLANVLEHSGAERATVVVTYTREAVEVVVSDDGRGPRPTTFPNGNGLGFEAAPVASGTGLVSLRERVALYGGELEARPRPDGGWRLRARIPIGSAG